MNNIVDCVGCKDTLQRFLTALSIEALDRHSPIVLDDLIITSKREICNFYSIGYCVAEKMINKHAGINEALLESNWKIAWFL